jgi:putative membrane protein
MTALVPLDLPGDAAEHSEGGHGFVESLLGFGLFALVLVALVAGYLILRQRGVLPGLSLAALGVRRQTRPEDAAKQILAERFAHGDLSTEEFMERASALNWTPGLEAAHPRHIRRT